MIVFTLINVVLELFESNLYFLFSATLPLLAVALGGDLAWEFYNNAFLIAGTALAFFGVALYFICWLLSKRIRAFMLVALILFAIDTIALAWLAIVFIPEFDVFFLIELAFQVWILVSLILGTAAWAKLRRATSDEMDATVQAIAFDEVMANDQKAADVLQRGETDGSIVSPRVNTSPLRDDDKKGRILVSGEQNGLQISMKRSRGLTELIVNGYVYDEVKGTLETGYTLFAHIQGTKITGIYQGVYMYIYVDNQLIAKKLRLY